MAIKILTVDDDINILKSIEDLLSLKKYKVFPHLTSSDALRNFEEIKPDLAIIDYFMPDATGIELMRKLHEKTPGLPVIILTASREVSTAIEAIKEGAYHYLVKPVQPDELFGTIDKIVEQVKLKKENRQLREELSTKYRFDSIIGKSGALKEVFEILSRAIKTKSTVLITGESGTGKELIARAIHYSSGRKDGPFIKVNCAAIPESMLEAELFGIEKNVATGVGQRAGKFEMADGGSIFLDEIGDMSTAMQAKVLRVLQERELERIGSHRVKMVDIRVIAATHNDLPRSIEEKKFREDLFYRLNVFHVHMPELAKRKEDIPLLVEHFIEKYCAQNDMPLKKIDGSATDVLMEMPWPGNIRELENTIERAVGICDGDTITTKDFDHHFQTSAEPGGEPRTAGNNLDDKVAEFERKIIIDTLERNRWKQNKAAQELGISERSMWYKIKKLGINIKKAS